MCDSRPCFGMGNFIKAGENEKKHLRGCFRHDIEKTHSTDNKKQTGNKESKKTFWKKIYDVYIEVLSQFSSYEVFPLLKRRWALSWFLHHLGSDLNWKKGSEFRRNGILLKFTIIYTRWAPTNDEYRVITPLIGVISPVIYLSLYIYL